MLEDGSTIVRLRRRYEARLAVARDHLGDLRAEEREARRNALARIDNIYVSGAALRLRDPEIRRLRRAERRARQSEAS